MQEIANVYFDEKEGNYKYTYYDESLKKCYGSIEFPYVFYSTPCDLETNDYYIIEDTNVVGDCGEKLVKVTLRENTQAMKDYARTSFMQAGAKLFESDVSWNDKLLTKCKGLKFSRTKRVFFIDIETDLCNTPANPAQPITAITVYDNFTDKYFVFVWQEGLINHQTLEDNKAFMYHADEVSMLKDFMRLFAYFKPDLVVGWYSNGFDIPYIYNRMKLLGLRAGMLDETDSFYVKTKQRMNDVTFDISSKTIDFVDLIDVVKKAIHKQPASYRLSDVSRFYLGQDYHKYEGGSPASWHDKKRLDDFLKYNLRDVELIVKLDKSIGLINYILTVQTEIAPIKLSKSLYNSKVLDNFLMYTHDNVAFHDKEKTFILNGEHYNCDDCYIRIEGAKVLPPKSGFYKNVAIFDFSGMYPSIYRTFNFSPDTISQPGKGNILLKDNVIQVMKVGSEEAATEVKFDLCFSTEKRGLVPEIIERLVERRNYYKKIRAGFDKSTIEWKKWNGLQDAIKEITNSFYGVMSFSKFRLFTPEVGAAITYVGRMMIEFTAEQLEALGYKVIYGDTDSVFFVLPEELSEEECMKRIELLERHLNEKLKELTASICPDCVKWHCLKIEFQSLFKTFMMPPVKKKYIGLLYDGHLYMKGIELIRKDTPEPFKDFMSTVVEKMLKEEDRSEIRAYINERKKRMQENVTPWQLGIVKQISRNIADYKVMPQHVRAAVYSNAHFGTDFKKTDNPRMLYVKGPTDIIAVPEEDWPLPKGFRIDWERYFEMFIVKKLELLDEIPGLDITQLYSDQRKLEAWF
jgi:DNA polymerase elongation subunit (family B)